MQPLHVFSERRADIAQADRQPGFSRQFAERLRAFGAGGEQPAAEIRRRGRAGGEGVGVERDRGGRGHQRDVQQARAGEQREQARQTPAIPAILTPSPEAPAVRVEVGENAGRGGGEQL